MQAVQISFPLVDAGHDRCHGQRETADSPLPSSETMRILIVADDPLLGGSLKGGLSLRGFEVDWVQDDQAAEREMRAEPSSVRFI